MIHSAIYDDFLPHFDAWRAMADEATFADLRSPVDGVVYPNICQLPEFAPAIAEALLAHTGRTWQIHHLFMRLSVEGCKPPHWAHHDASMGEYSLMIYLNRPQHCQGGTALLQHVSGTDPDEAQWRLDTNRMDRWKIQSQCHMATNRAFLFQSRLLHAALPITGFGTDQTNGRLLMTAFIS